MTPDQLSALLAYIDAAIANAIATDDYIRIEDKHQIESIYTTRKKKEARSLVEIVFSTREG